MSSIFKKLFIFPLIITSCLLGDVAIWVEDDIDFSNLKVIKSIPLHTVYESCDCFIKIWNKETRNRINGRNDAFFEAAVSHALDHIAPLIAVIVDENGACSGYATFKCSVCRVDFSKIKREGFKGCYGSDDSIAFLYLLSRMRACTLIKGFCFSDLDPSNMGMHEGVCYYFDLDGVWKLDAYRENFQTNPLYLENQFKKLSKTTDFCLETYSRGCFWGK